MLREYTRLRSYRGLYLPFTIFVSVIISMLIPVEAYDAGPDVAITNVLLASSAIGIWVAVYFYLLDLVDHSPLAPCDSRAFPSLGPGDDHTTPVFSLGLGPQPRSTLRACYHFSGRHYL